MTDTTGADAQQQPMTPAQLWERELTRDPDTVTVDPEDGTRHVEPAPEAPGQDLSEQQLDADQQISEDIQEFEPEASAEPEAELDSPPQPAISPPPGMSADDAASFAQLTPQQQAWVVQREAQRSADYTAKTSEIAAARQAAEAARLEAQRATEQAAQVLQQFVAQGPQPPDQSLAETDPDLYQQQATAFLLAQTQHQAAAQQLQALQSQQAAQREAELAQLRTTEDAKLGSLIPGGSDPAKLTAARAEITAYALTNGYQQQALDNATAQDKLVLWKAMQFDKGRTQATPRPTGGKPRGKQPGPGRNPREDRNKQDFSEVASAAAKSGRRDAGAALWQNLLENQGK